MPLNHAKYCGSSDFDGFSHKNPFFSLNVTFENDMICNKCFSNSGLTSMHFFHLNRQRIEISVEIRSDNETMTAHIEFEHKTKS